MPRKPPASPITFKQQSLASFFSSPIQQASSSSPVKQPHKPRRVATLEPESTSSDNSDIAGIKFEPEVINLSEEDASPRRPKANRTSQSQRIVGSDDDEDSEFKLGSKKRVEKKKNSKKLRKRKQVIEESESEEEEEVQPKKRKFVKGVRPSSPEEDDIDEVEEHRESVFLEHRPSSGSMDVV